jgi:hypothetical protein
MHTSNESVWLVDIFEIVDLDLQFRDGCFL